MKYYSLSDIGSFREKNQDSCYSAMNSNGDFMAIVCDGIGGAKAGEVASEKAKDFMAEKFQSAPFFNDIAEMISFIEITVISCNEFVYQESLKDFRYRGMGTTLTGMLVSKTGKISFNVGDSRVYGIAKDEIKALTEDDTLVNEMLKRGEITALEAENHPKKHYLVKAIGVPTEMKPAIQIMDDYDYYLVCSDGLHGYLEKERIHEICMSDNELSEKCSNMLSLTLLKGGYDNITLVLVENE